MPTLYSISFPILHPNRFKPESIIIPWDVSSSPKKKGTGTSRTGYIRNATTHCDVPPINHLSELIISQRPNRAFPMLLERHPIHKMNSNRKVCLFLFADSESGSGAEVDPNLPYPGIAPYSLKYLSQTTRPRSWCLALISNPYPFLICNRTNKVGSFFFSLCVCVCVSQAQKA